MRKFVLFLLLFVCITNISYASKWFELLDKKYVDISSTSVSNGCVSFWIKALKKPGEEITGIGGNFWYSLDKWTIDCKNKKNSVDVIMIYDTKEKLIFSDELPRHEWHSIAPDTYADAYYRYFCIFPFDKNPLINQPKH